MRLTALLGLLLFGLVVGVVVMNVLSVIPSGSKGSPNDPPPSAAALIGAEMPGESVHAVGAIGLFTVGVASLVGLILKPERSGPALQVLAVSIAWIVTVPIVGDPNNVGGQAGPIDPIFLAVAVPSFLAGLLAVSWRRRRAVSGDHRFLILAAIAALPASWYAIDQALMQRNTFPPTADPHHNAHWWVMAIMALAVVFLVASAGLTSDGRTAVLLAGATGLAFGLASLVAPSSASVVRWPWGAAIIAWSAAVLVLLRGRFARRELSRSIRADPD